MSDSPEKKDVEKTESDAKGGFKPGALLGGIRGYISGLSSEPRTRYLTVLWGFVFIFLGISLLSASNPFRLLIPGSVFPKPIRDSRQAVKVYGVKNDLSGIKAVNRLMLPATDVGKRMRRLAFLISRPAGLREGAEAVAANLAPMPNLGLGIRRVWFSNKGNTGLVVVDMRRSAMDTELTRFLKARRASRRGKKAASDRRRQRKEKAEQAKLQARYLDGWFRALAASALEGKDVRSVRFLLDGEVARVRGMEFDLRDEHTAAVPAAEKPKKK